MRRFSAVAVQTAPLQADDVPEVGHRRPPLPHGRPRRARDLLSRVNAVAVLLVLVDSGTLAAVGLDRGIGWTWSGAIAATVLTIRATWRVYRRRLWLSWLQDLPRSAASTALAFALLTGIGLISSAPADEVVAVQWAMITFALVIEPTRWCVFAFGRWCRRRVDRCDRTIIVGAGEVGVHLAKTMLEHPQFGLRPVAFADSGPDPDRHHPGLEFVD